ncbi:threonine synthase [Salibacterium aidingense]|uniref:threonine synthase n=1 Tax=Salibacterium aidingense TaxID=384933 RepID=UPI003BBFD183
MKWTYASSYQCDGCKRMFPLRNNKITTCTHCGELLEVRYDLNTMKQDIDKNTFKQRKKSIWRWHEFLPLHDEKNIISLGEGDTPLVPSIYIGKKLGLKNLYLKNDTLMPTGSFKDRGFSLALSFARELGVTQGLTYSSGNAGVSFAAYSQRGEMNAAVLIEYLANPLKKALIQLCGGQSIVLHYESMEDITMMLEEASRKLNLYQFVNFINPIRHEAMKTYAYEITEALDWKSPDYMVHPVGTGGGLYGTWKGFLELNELGWIDKLPKMAAVQPEATGPHVKAFNKGQHVVEKTGDPSKTMAQSISADSAIKDGRRVLNALYDSEGLAEAVKEAEIVEAMNDLGKEGIIADPASAATVASLKKLTNKSLIPSDSTIVCVITGSGLKQPKAIESHFNEETKNINADFKELTKILTDI